jgi:hypothetical protein
MKIGSDLLCVYHTKSHRKFLTDNQAGYDFLLRGRREKEEGKRERGEGKREERLLMDVLFARGLFKFKSTRFLLVLEAR